MFLFTLPLRGVDPDTKLEVEFMSAATQKQGPSRGGGIQDYGNIKTSQR